MRINKNKVLFSFIAIGFITGFILPVFSVQRVNAQRIDNAYGYTKTIGSTGGDYVYGMTLDSNKNTYITGNFAGTVDFDPGAGTDNHTAVGLADGYITKINSDGTYGWTKTFGVNANFVSGNGIAADSNNNLYATGNFGGTVDFDPGAGTDNHATVGSDDIFLLKLDSNGIFVYCKTMGSTAGDYGKGVAISDANKVYLTGTFNGTVDFDPGAGTDNHAVTGTTDSFVAKFEADGSYDWAKNVGGGGTYAVANVVTVDPQGNPIYTGYYSGTVDFDPGAGTDNHTAVGTDDIFVSKLDSTGSLLWAKTMGSNGFENSYGITSDSNSNVFIVGYFSGNMDFNPGTGTDNKVLTGGSAEDAFLTKLNSDGSYGWTDTFGGTNYDEAYSVVTDRNNNIYLSGQFGLTVDFDPTSGVDNHTVVTNGWSDAFITRINSDNTYGWTYTNGGSGGVNLTYGSVVVADQSDNVYLAGRYRTTNDFDPTSGVDNHTSAGQYDIFLSKYTQTTYNQISGLPSGAGAKTVSGTDVTTSGNGLLNGTTSAVRLYNTTNGVIYADITASFNTDLDWSSVTMGSDSASRKSFVHNVTNVAGAGSSFTLYIPYSSSDKGVGICPAAASLAEVNSACSGLYYLSTANSNVSLVTIDGNQYWAVSGLTGTGGFGTSSLGLAQTGQDSTLIMNVAVLFIGAGILYILAIRVTKYTK